MEDTKPQLGAKTVAPRRQEQQGEAPGAEAPGVLPGKPGSKPWRQSVLPGFLGSKVWRQGA